METNEESINQVHSVASLPGQVRPHRIRIRVLNGITLASEDWAGPLGTCVLGHREASEGGLWHPHLVTDSNVRWGIFNFFTALLPLKSVTYHIFIKEGEFQLIFFPLGIALDILNNFIVPRTTQGGLKIRTIKSRPFWRIFPELFLKEIWI